MASFRSERDIFLVVTQNGTLKADILRLAGRDGRLRTTALDQLKALDDPLVRLVIFDVDVAGSETDRLIRLWKERALARNLIVIFVIEPSMRTIFVEQGLTTDANIAVRPISSENFADLIENLWHRQRAGHSKVHFNTRCYSEFPDQAEALISADEVLTSILGMALGEANIGQEAIENRCATVLESLAATGAPRWTEAVRTHHNLTYQHSLLVMGASVAFGQHLGFSDKDLKRLAAGALLHDLGKSRIPVAILDKSDSLTPEEFSIIKSHPVVGHGLLKDSPDFTSDILHLVLHHHEYLDGSGYPDGLMHNSIPDVTRLLTIADIFAALVEKRPYKAALSGEKAYRIMQLMTGKLDMSILRPLLKVANAIPAA